MPDFTPGREPARMAECLGMKLAVHVDSAADMLTPALDAAQAAGFSAVELGAGSRAPAMVGAAAALRARELRLCALSWKAALAEGLEVAAAIGAPALVLPADRLAAMADPPLPIFLAARAGTGDLERVRPDPALRLAAVLAWPRVPGEADEPVSPGAIAAEIDRCQAWVEHVHIVGPGDAWPGSDDRRWLMPALRVLHRIGYEGYLVLHGPPATPEALSGAVRRLRDWVEEAWTA